jgi:toxin ParE1/3/4
LALQDLKNIGDYIAKDNVTAAHNFVGRLKEKCNLLAESPGIGRKRDELFPNVRSVTEGNYVIFYRQSGDAIEVIRVVHGKRDLGKLKFEDK